MKTVHLATLDNISQAHIVQDILQNEGIESFMKNEILSTVINTPGFELEVEVFEEDYEKALDIIKKGFPYLVNE